jgi:2'-5' RNA ligase
MSETLRLFVAVELPGEVREALGRLQHELQRRGLEKLRWVRPEGIHLTLKFLGETPTDRVSAIEDALTGAVDRTAPHKLALGELGAFGGSRPRVLWVDLRGDLRPVQGLRERVESSLADAGFPPEGRSWSPHLTLARVRPETTREVATALPAALEAVRPPVGVIPVHEVSLMRSTLRPADAVYERIAGFPLVGA